MRLQLPLKGAQPPVFGPCILWPNGWLMKTPLGTELDLGPGHFVLDGDAAPHCQRGTATLPSFRPMSIMATITNLSYCWALVYFGQCSDIAKQQRVKGQGWARRRPNISIEQGYKICEFGGVYSIVINDYMLDWTVTNYRHWCCTSGSLLWTFYHNYLWELPQTKLHKVG